MLTGVVGRKRARHERKTRRGQDKNTKAVTAEPRPVFPDPDFMREPLARCEHAAPAQPMVPLYPHLGEARLLRLVDALGESLRELGR
jgi:hypothetical protein